MSAGLPSSCNEAAENKYAHGDVIIAATTAAEVQRNSAWELRLDAAHEATRCANTGGARDLNDEWLTAAAMIPVAHGRHCSSR